MSDFSLCPCVQCAQMGIPFPSGWSLQADPEKLLEVTIRCNNPGCKREIKAATDVQAAEMWNAEFWAFVIANAKEAQRQENLKRLQAGVPMRPGSKIVSG